jgi:hypothetical protein
VWDPWAADTMSEFPTADSFQSPPPGARERVEKASLRSDMATMQCYNTPPGLSSTKAQRFQDAERETANPADCWVQWRTPEA